MDKRTEDGTPILSATRFKQVLIILFAAIAFLMTVYATSGGARMFLTESYAWVGITALAVGFLAFTSVVLGDGISSGRMPQVALVTPFYLIAVAICWISSFASYHQQFLSVGGSDLANAETNLRQIGLYAYDINRDVKDRYSRDRNALLNDDALKDYSARMNQLADDLRDRDTQMEIEVELAALIEARIEEQKNRQIQLQDQQSNLKADALSLAAQVETHAKTVNDRQNQRVATETLIGQLELALRQEEGDTDQAPGGRGVLEADGLAGQLVDDPACNRRRRAGTGGGLIGTCYNALGEKLAEIRALTPQDQSAYEAALAELQAARDQQSSLQAEIAALDEEIKAAVVEDSEGMAARYALDADGFLQSVNAFTDTPSQSNFEQTANYCLMVTEILANLQSISEVPACKPQPTMAIFRQIDALDASHANYEAACEEADRRKEIVETLRTEISGLTGSQRLNPISQAYEVMRSDVVEPCIMSAEQRGLDMTPYRQDISGLVDRINPSQDPISTAMGKIQSLFNGTASARDYFPALLALLQELSLLLSKLFWDASIMAKTSQRKDEFDISELDLEAKPDDPEWVLAAKNIILNAVFDRPGYRLPALYDEEYSHEMRNQMRLILDTLIRKQLAKATGQRISISEAGMAEIGRRIQRHNETVEGRAAKRDATPIGTAVSMVEKTKTTDAKPQDPAMVQSADQTDVLEDEAEPDSAENVASETSQSDDGESAQRPRRRRPVVVRPNFRREI
ncbi:hypothetical protein HPDFL43_07162 [Hoeflea phototrophica DFL-43]|uniref:Uncharacterized protein n=1 Tax=Hoeflea phototrophica (strain DSM 17068 / NCIMB 14078 / DFL-43) TaxID=411684 RepID=A9DCZ8_HOEPD|nr:hypothetical protein [Hoeflea phototrophica]EDQ32241.1 hypothetical protein HPDFL43_07162 [Hoeflea phototrophica DFL-43]